MRCLLRIAAGSAVLLVLATPLRAQNRQEDWWSFRLLARPSLPSVKDQSWILTPIDSFILAKLESKGVKPSPAADRVTFIRRATYDLHGLPPTPEEIEGFITDSAPDAYEKLINRLLNSPRY